MLLSDSGAVSEAERLKQELKELQHKIESERHFVETVQQWRKSLLFDARAKEFDAQLRKRMPNVGVLFNMTDSRRERLVCDWIKLPKQHAIDEDEFYKAQIPFHLLDANVESFRKCTKLALNHGNILRYPGTTQKRFERWGMKELLIYPIYAQANKHTIGTCMLFSDKGRFTQQERQYISELIESYSGQFYLSWFHSLRQEQEQAIKRLEEEQKRFYSFISQASELTSVKDIYTLGMNEMLARHPFDICGMVMKDNDELRLKAIKINEDHPEVDRLRAFAEHYETHHYNFNPKDGATSYCFIRNSMMYFPDMVELMDHPMSPKDRTGLAVLNGTRTFVLLPIRNGSTAIGVLWLISATQVLKISDEELQMSQMLANYIGSAINNTGLYEQSVEQAEKIATLNEKLNSRVDELRMLATTDNLTGLNNFAYFEAELSRRMCESERASPNKQLAVVIIDVDHFKSFNDNYGHLAGNHVLKEIASRIQDVGRDMDIPCRYGGEEFVVILPRCDITGAEKFAERVRKSVAMVPFELNGKLVKITVSLGCAQFVNPETMSALIDRADKALYAAKAKGRNCVVVAPNEESGA